MKAKFSYILGKAELKRKAIAQKCAPKCNTFCRNGAQRKTDCTETKAKTPYVLCKEELKRKPIAHKWPPKCDTFSGNGAQKKSDCTEMNL